MRVLVTGAFGNVGTYAVDELLRRGTTVRCLDIPSRVSKRKARPFAGKVEILWGDIRKTEVVARAVKGVDAIVHLAFIIPPKSEQRPAWAETINVGGTWNLLQAALASPRKPRIVFSSSIALYGKTQHLPPPRTSEEPLHPDMQYAYQKLTCEHMLHASGLPWVILRFGAVPPIEFGELDPLMFDVRMDDRMEYLAPMDAGAAVASAALLPGLEGRTLMVAGGPSCQVTGRQFMERSFDALGIGMLPESAFSPTPFHCDFMDTEESERLLHYQHHSFEETLALQRKTLGWKVLFVPVVRPFLRRRLLAMSPYYKRPRGRGMSKATTVSILPGGEALK
ncbi:MAG: NAD(P)-dependent oxidoreductase [Caldiserica bacterium]|nr:NAD(P)-dependent oxidoreductase [Caldisericota bacterium]